MSNLLNSSNQASPSLPPLQAHFLQSLHTIWMTDTLSMDEYMDFIWPYMVRHGVNWKQPNDLDMDNFLRCVEKNCEADELFAYEVNDMSKDIFANFCKTCLAYMDFTVMFSQLKKAA